MTSLKRIWLASVLAISLTACTPRILSGLIGGAATSTSSDSSGSSIVTFPGSLLADGSSSSTVTVTLKDKSGSPMVGKSIVLVSDRGSLDTVTTSSGPSDPNGKVVFKVRSTHAGVSVYSATDVSDHAFVSASANVTFLAGSYIPSQSALVAAQPSVPADGISTTSITVTLMDAQGNPVPGKAVSLTSSRGGSDLIVPPSGFTNSNGIINFTASSSVIGLATYTASVGSNPLPKTVPVQFTAGPGSASRSTVSASPLTVTADGTSTSTVTVTLIDSLGNPVLGKTVSLASNRGSSDTISAASGASDSSGVVTFTVKSSNIGSPTFTATDVTDSIILSQTASVGFVAGVASVSQSTLTASNLTVPDDGVTTSTLTVTLKDSGGNPSVGKTVTLTSSRGGSDTISAASGPSTASGVVTFSVKSTISGSSTFTATDTTDSTVVAQTASVSFLPGAVSSSLSTVTPSPSTLSANGSSTSTITVTLRDGGSNPVSGKTVTLSSNRGATDTISAASGASNASGIVTFTVSSLVSGSAVFSAFESTDSVVITQTATVTYTAGTVSAGQSTVVTSPSSVIADGTTTSTVTVTLLDAQSNPVSGKTVTLASNRGGTDTISSASGASNASGVVTFTVKSSTIGTSTLTATDTTDSITLSQAGTVAFGTTTSASNSTVVASPTLVSGDGLATSTITVTLVDGSSNPVSGKSVTLSSSRGGTDTLSTSNSVSDTNGQVVFTLSSSTVGNAVLTAQDTSDSLTISQTATVHFYDGVTSNSTILATPESIPADNSSLATVLVTLLDSTSTGVPGKSVTLSSSRGSIDTISTISGTTNANGQATFTLKSNKIGMPLITASDTTDGITLSGTYRINILGTGAVPQTDYRADLANLGNSSGSNSLPTSFWQNGEVSGSTNRGTLYNFSFATTSGWSGDGSLLTSGAFGPNRLVFNGTSNYVDFGSSIDSNSSLSFETWMRPSQISTLGSVILSNIDSNNVGFTLKQTSRGIALEPGVSNYNAAVLADSPQIYYTFNDASGSSVAIDSSGNNNTGTYYASGSAISYPDYSLTGGSGGSAVFPGTAVSRVYTNNSFTVSTPYSIETWFSSTSTAGGVLVSLETLQQYHFDYDFQIVLLPSGQILMWYYLNNAITFTTSGTYNDGQPHHVVATYSDTNGLNLYVDGVTVATGSPAGTPNSFTGYWSFGGSSCSGVPNCNAVLYFNGNLSNSAIYTTELSAARVLAHYNARSSLCISSPLSPNVWNFLTGTINGAGGLVNLYVNGNSQCSVTYSSLTATGGSADLVSGSSPTQTNPWAGSLAALRTYASTLSSTAVQSNYAATAAQFDIQQLGAPSPILWYRADAIQGLSDGASVATWSDSSGNGNNATQASSGNRPVWKQNVLNGYPVVRFNGTNSSLIGPNVFPTNSDYSVVYVYSVASNNPNNNIFSSPDGNRALFMINNSPAIYQGGGAPYSSIAFNNNQFYSVSAVINNSAQTASFFTDGVPAGVLNLGASNSDSGIQVGGDNNSYFLQGDIAEILLFGSALSTNDRTLIESYLNAKYGLF